MMKAEVVLDMTFLVCVHFLNIVQRTSMRMETDAKMAVSWDVTPCGQVDISRCFIAAY
jgi:hypothetical protein